MKKRLVTLVLAMMLVCALAATMLVGCGPKNDQPETKAKATTYVALDINPSVELLLDENNVVVSAKGLNEDAKVLLYGEDGIVGADVKLAAKKIGELSAECKYVGEENKAVNVTIGGQSASGESALKADLEAGLKEGTKLELKVEVGANFSLEREIEALKKQYPDNEKIQNIDIAKYRVIKEAMEADPSLTIEIAVSLDFSELLERVDDAREAAIEAGIEMLPKAQQVALEAAEDAYEAIKERLETVVYMQAAKPGVLDPAFATHIGYIAYKNIDITLDQIDSLIEQAHANVKEEVKKADVDAIFAALVENGVLTEEQANAKKAELTDKDGNADLDKIEAYLDIVLKNAKEDTLDAVEDALDSVLDRVEDEIEALTEDIPETIREDVKKLIDDVAAEINNELKEAGVDLGKAETIVNNIINKVLDIDPMTFSYEQFEKLSDFVEAQLEGGEYEYYNALTGKDETKEVAEADSFEAKVKASMTKEQLATADQLKANIKNDNTKLAQAKTAYDNAVKQAIADADTYLKQAKADRKAA